MIAPNDLKIAQSSDSVTHLRNVLLITVEGLTVATTSDVLNKTAVYLVDAGRNRTIIGECGTLGLSRPSIMILAILALFPGARATNQPHDIETGQPTQPTATPDSKVAAEGPAFEQEQ